MSNATASPYPDADPPPELRDYELVRLIGAGGYGNVWLGTNRTTGKVVAVKFVPLGLAGTSIRATREIRSLICFENNVRIQHENLLPIHHVGQTDDALYYVMEAADDTAGRPASLGPSYVPATLAERLERGALPAPECLRRASQLLSGLACLHDAGLVHRDIKPSNCLFVKGTLKLADFGLLTESDSTLSQVGTLKYMPAKGKMDARADVYAAGLTIYEMLTGLPAEGFPRWPPSLAAAGENPVVRALNRLVLRACQQDPEDRFQNGGQMLTALAQWATSARSGMRRYRKAIVVLAACILLALVVAFLTLWPRGEQRVAVNFITVPFEAEIYLDGKKAADPRGRPYTTPCTIPGLSTCAHQVVFKRKGLPDLIVGSVDFARQRDVQVNWEPEVRP